MSPDSLMGKFEALMRKHRGGADAAATPALSKERQAPSPDAWLPVLTDVVERGRLPPAAQDPQLPATEGTTREPEVVLAQQSLVLPPEAVPETPVAAAAAPETAPVSEPVPEPSAETPDAQIAASLVDELAPKITGLMQEQVAEELRKSLDQSMANLMANLNANVEEIVRQAIAEKLAGKDKKSS